MNARTRTTTTAVGVPLALILLAACGSSEEPTASTPENLQTSGSATPTPAESVEPTPDEPGTSTPTASPPSDEPSPKASAKPTKPAASKKPGKSKKPEPEDTNPRLTKAKVSYDKTCIPGDHVEPQLTWATKNATGMALSVDNPGLVGSFGEYGPHGTMEMPSIGCTGEAGDVITHRYDLYPLGGTDGQTQQGRKTITVKVTVGAP